MGRKAWAIVRGNRPFSDKIIAVCIYQEQVLRYIHDLEKWKLERMTPFVLDLQERFASNPSGDLEAKERVCREVKASHVAEWQTTLDPTLDWSNPDDSIDTLRYRIEETVLIDA